MFQTGRESTLTAPFPQLNRGESSDKATACVVASKADAPLARRAEVDRWMVSKVEEYASQAMLYPRVRMTVSCPSLKDSYRVDRGSSLKCCQHRHWIMISESALLI